jgi:hypothetical protein
MDKFLKSLSPLDPEDEHQRFLDDIYSLYQIKPVKKEKEKESSKYGTKRSRKSEPTREKAAESLAKSRESKYRQSMPPSRSKRFDLPTSSSSDENTSPPAKKKMTVNPEVRIDSINLVKAEVKKELAPINLVSSDDEDNLKQPFVLEVLFVSKRYRDDSRNTKINSRIMQK